MIRLDQLIGFEWAPGAGDPQVDDFDAVMQRAAEMSVGIVLPRHRNRPDGNGEPNHWG